MIQQINWSWYLEYINAGYLSLTWLEFVVAVWENQGTIFCELCGNPVITSIMMCGMM